MIYSSKKKFEDSCNGRYIACVKKALLFFAVVRQSKKPLILRVELEKLMPKNNSYNFLNVFCYYHKIFFKEKTSLAFWEISLDLLLFAKLPPLYDWDCFFFLWRCLFRFRCRRWKKALCKLIVHISESEYHQKIFGHDSHPHNNNYTICKEFDL